MSQSLSEEAGARVPLREHIRELRTRIIRVLLVVTVAIFAAWAVHEQIFTWLMEPYTRAMTAHHPDVPHYIEYRSLTEPLVVYFKASAVAALIATIPYIITEIWLFIVPGLYREERRMAGAFLFATMVMFYSGVFFCRYLVLDPAVSVLLSIGAANTNASIMMTEYFGFTTRMLLVFGLVFELPVVLSFLSFLGIVDYKWLLKQWRYAVVIMAVVAAVLTPPDPISQTLLLIPLVGLYFVSVGIAFMFARRREKSALEAATEDTLEEAPASDEAP